MRILILANNDVGLYRFRKELIENLIKKNEVYGCLPYGELIPLVEALGMKYIRDDFNRHGINPINEIKHYIKYSNILHKIRPDIVLTYTIKPNIFGGMACAHNNIPYIVNVTGLGTALEKPGLLSSFLTHLYKFSVRKAKMIFFQNKSNYEYMISHGFIDKKCAILPGSGVNLEENCLETYPPEDNGVHFLFVGRIMKDKGIEEFLYCAKKVKEKYPYCSFDIVGGYDDETYRIQINDYQEKGIVTYMGHQNDVHSIMKSHHALIQPSYHEGLSNVMLEACSCGRPVLASTIPGCQEILDDGINGIGFHPRDGDSLVKSVEKFLSKSYEERKKMGIAARNKVEREFDRQIVTRAYLDEIYS